MTEAKSVFTGKALATACITGGLASMATGLIIYFLVQLPYPQSVGLLSGALLTGLVMICAGLYFYVKECNSTVYDERSARTNAQAGYAAFILSFVLLDALAISSGLGIVRIGYDLIVWATIMAMPWIFLIMRFIIGRRGEVV